MLKFSTKKFAKNQIVYIFAHKFFSTHMGSWTIYRADGAVREVVWSDEVRIPAGRYAVPELEYNGEWMGEAFVTLTVRCAVPVEFEVGDYVLYRGEKFVMNYDPTVVKKARRGTHGEGFVYENVKFNSLGSELADARMLDYVIDDNLIHYSGLPKFSFFCKDVDDLADRLQVNMNRYCDLNGFATNDYWLFLTPSTDGQGNPVRTLQRAASCGMDAGVALARWTAVYGGTADGRRVAYQSEKVNQNVSVENQSVWECCKNVKDVFGLNFIVRGRDLCIGTAGLPTADIFRYGKGKGLYEIERTADSEQAIVTKLFAYGSSKNLPTRYYANLNAVCFLTITGVEENGNDGTQDNYLLSYVGDADVYGMFRNRTSTDNGFYCTVGVRLSVTGDVTETLLSYNTSRSVGLSIPCVTWQGYERGEGLPVGTRVYFYSGIDKDKWPAGNTDYSTDNLPNNMALDVLMLPGFPNQSLYDWVLANGGTALSGGDDRVGHAEWRGHRAYFSKDKYQPYILSENYLVLGIREAAKYFDGSDGEDEIFPTIENTGKDAVVSAERIQDNGVFGEGDIPNFKIRLPDFGSGFDLKALLQSDTAIEMKDGYCGGRSFSVVGAKKVDGVWECECKRSRDDALDLYFPYQHGATGDAYQVLAGDKYVLTGIEMTDTYVEEAAKVLLEASLVFLDANDYTRYTYVPRVDEIYMARQHDAAVASRGGNAAVRSYYETLKEGDVMLFEDADLGIDGSVFIDTLRIKEYGNGQIPTYEVTLRNDKQVGTIQRIQEKINSLTSTGGGGGGGVNVPQIQSLIGTYGKELFLSKKEADAAQGFIQFLQGMGVGSSGMGISREGAARLLSVVLNGGYGIDAGGKATLADVVARLITATGLVSPDYGGDDLVGGSGFKMEYDALTGRSSVFTDFLTVRMKAIFAALEIRKVTYSSGTLVVSGAGSQVYRVLPVGSAGSVLGGAQYEAVEYLEKTGNAGYFNTGYIPNNNTRIEARILLPSGQNAHRTLWCSRTDTTYTSTAKPSFCMWPYAASGSGVTRLDWRDKRYNGSLMATDVAVEVSAENGVLTYPDSDGNIVTLGVHTEVEWDGIYPLNIWVTRNGNSSSTTNQGRGRIYRFKIYEDGVLLHDYQPARRTSDGHLGLFDLANNIFLENNGATSTSIVAGDVITTEETDGNYFFQPHYDEVPTADIYAYRCYCVADDGTTATMNDWHVGDQVLCQTFNIDAGVYENVSNRYWWRLALRTGTEVLDDGKQYTWVEVASNQQDLQRITEPMMQAYAVYADLYAAYQAMSEKPSFFEAYATVFPRYDGGGEGEVTACDVPEEGDTMAQVGSQTEDRRMGLAMVRADGVDSGFYIYAGVNSFTLSGRLVTKITPRGTVMSSQFFRIVSSADVGNPKPLTVFRGEWSASEAYAYYDEVTYGGERWACVNAAGVAAGGNPPSRTNNNWLLTVAKGNDGEAGVVRWMEVSTMTVETYQGEATSSGTTYKTTRTKSDISGDFRVTLYQQSGSTITKVRDDANFFANGSVNRLRNGTRELPNMLFINGKTYPSDSGVLRWDSSDECYVLDGGLTEDVIFERLAYTWEASAGVAYDRKEILLSVDGEKGDKGDKGDAGTNGHAFTLSPTQAVVTQTATRGTDGNYTYGWDVNNNSVLTRAQYRSGNGGAVACDVSVLSVVPSAAVGIFQPEAQMEVGNVGINTAALTAFVRQYGQNSVAATLRLVSGNIYQDLTFNLYINRLGTMKSETVGDATETIRQKTNWVVDEQTGVWKQMAYKSDVTDAADRFSRELSAVPVSRNILLNTDFVEHRQGGGVREMHIVSSAANQGYKHIRTDNVLAYGTAYRLSFYARGTGNVRAYFYVQSNGSTVLTRYINAQVVTDNLQRFSLVITTPSDNIEGYGFELRLMSAASGADIYISRMQLEQGSTVTYWSPTEAKNLLLNSDLAQVDENYAPVYWEAHDGSGTPTKRELTMAVAPWWVSWNDKQYEGFMLTRQEVNAENMELWQSAHITPNTDRHQSEETAYQGIAQYGSVIGERPLKHAKYYAVSFYAKGTGTTDLIFHLFNEGVNVNIGGWIGNSFSLTSSWKRYTWAFCALPELATNYDSGYGFKLMLGCYHAYDVMPAGEDMYISRVQLEEVTEAQYNVWYADHSTEIASEWRRGEENTGVQSSRYEQTAEEIAMSVKKGEKVGGIRIDETGTTLFGEQTTVEGDLDLNGLTTENVARVARNTYYPTVINMGIVENGEDVVKSVQVYGEADGLTTDTNNHIVVLPFYDSDNSKWTNSFSGITPNDDKTFNLYPGKKVVQWKKAGTRVTVTNSVNYRYRNWQQINDANYANMLNAFVVVCADGRVISRENITSDSKYNPSTDADGSSSAHPQLHAGVFSCGGYLSRFIILLPGQTLQLRSQIISVSSREVLVWFVENPSEFEPYHDSQGNSQLQFVSYSGGSSGTLTFVGAEGSFNPTDSYHGSQESIMVPKVMNMRSDRQIAFDSLYYQQ